MRVCVVVPSFYPAVVYGGPIISTYHSCAELAKLGIHVSVATTNANRTCKLDVPVNRYVRFSDRFRVKYYDDTIVGRFSWRLTLCVWRDIRACDCVRIEDIFSTYIPPALLFARLFRKPIMISPRGALSEWALRSKRYRTKMLWLKLLINPFLRDAWWHATSKQEEGEIRALYPKARIVIVANGIDTSAFNGAAVLPKDVYLSKFTRTNIRAGFIIISMGRLHSKKGFDVLIDSFARLPASFGDAVLLIAGGDDGEREKLEQQITNRGLRHRAFLVGELNYTDRITFLKGADLFVLPSHNENFGNVYLEAMAAGLPVVASKGTPWAVVEELQCGKWVENSVEATGQAMTDILSGGAAVMGERARKYAEQYDWANIAGKFQSIFRELLAERERAHA